MKISLESLEVIDAIARKGSFAAAAESLFRVPSAITYTVRKLEDDLGVALFNRSGHRAELTDAGLALLREGRLLLNAADKLEGCVKRIANGVETDLTLAINDLIDINKLHPVLDAFYAQNFGTRLKLTREVFGGSWDALISGRADIAIGAPGEGPSGGGYHVKAMGSISFVYAVAPHHPLANMAEPLQNQDILQYRAISAADTSRDLPPRTSGILTGQDVLTLPDMQAKCDAQIAGLGVGFLPKNLADKYVATGKLVIKEVAEPKPLAISYLAWRNYNAQNDTSVKDERKAQQWLLKELQKIPLDQLLL